MLSHKIRRATEEDLNDILRLFKSTVEAVNSKDYQPEQILVWKNRAICKDKWLEKIVDQYFIISINEFDVTGFASITKDGYLDFMYVSKDYQRMGIAKTLYRELETFARKQKIDRIISEVSITAKTFFEKLEFEVVDQQDVKIEGITLTNFKMQKQLF